MTREMIIEPLPHNHLLTLRLDVDVARAIRIGHVPAGHRSITPIVGGSFEGEHLNGSVLPGGADWVLTRQDGAFSIDVRLVLKTDDEALIYLNYQGRFVGDDTALADVFAGKTLEPERYSLAMTAQFECGVERYSWLNSVIAVGIGKQSGLSPTYTLYSIG